MTDPATDPLSLDRFTVRLDADTGWLVIADRDLTPITPETAARVLGDHRPEGVWGTSDRLGCIVFSTTDEEARLADILCDQLNDLDAAADAAQADTLINDAATLAERIEAEATDGLTAGQRRGLAAYGRAAGLPLYPYGEGCGEQFHVGDRVRIGDPADPYYAGALAGVGLYHDLLGQTATVILPQSPVCPLIALLDDADEVIALPHPSLYVRRAE
jgi:hypothetical protein